MPSGGTIQVDYESDDYQYVQDKRAMEMFKVVGAGVDDDPVGTNYFSPVDNVDNGTIDQTNSEALLYGNGEAKYLYVKLLILKDTV